MTKVLENAARAVVYTGPEKFEMREFPFPDLGDGDMLVEVELAGVDGSEIHMFHGELEPLNKNAPVIFGDEIIGKVVAAGKDACANRGIKVGDRIVVESRWSCDTCRYCKQGQYYLCRTYGQWNGYGAHSVAESPHLWGGYATHVYVPQVALTYPIPEALPPKAALISCSLLANSARWSMLVEAGPGTNVVVVGPGPQGIGCALAASHAGARVIVVGLEKDAERLRFCSEFGKVETEFFTKGQSATELAAAIQEKYGEIDSVIETAGATSAKELAFEVVRPTGIVANISLPLPQTQPFNWLQALMKELTILNPMSHPHFVDKGLALGASLLEKGLDVGEMVSDVFPLDRAEQAIRTAAYEYGNSALKVVIDPKI